MYHFLLMLIILCCLLHYSDVKTSGSNSGILWLCDVALHVLWAEDVYMPFR